VLPWNFRVGVSIFRLRADFSPKNLRPPLTTPSLAAFRFRAGQPAATRELTVNVARYTQQAVLMANVEEARYHVLMSKASFRC
jgi:hypothetical protein